MEIDELTEPAIRKDTPHQYADCRSGAARFQKSGLGRRPAFDHVGGHAVAVHCQTVFILFSVNNAPAFGSVRITPGHSARCRAGTSASRRGAVAIVVTEAIHASNQRAASAHSRHPPPNSFTKS